MVDVGGKKGGGVRKESVYPVTADEIGTGEPPKKVSAETIALCKRRRKKRIGRGERKSKWKGTGMKFCCKCKLGV